MLLSLSSVETTSFDEVSSNSENEEDDDDEGDEDDTVTRSRDNGDPLQLYNTCKYKLFGLHWTIYDKIKALCFSFLLLYFMIHGVG